MNEYAVFKVEGSSFKIKLGTFRYVVIAKVDDTWEIVRKSKTYKSAREAKYYYELSCMNPKTLMVSLEIFN